MAKVHNWQVGREMEYRFPEAHPQRQFVAVFNTNRCIGCQTCTMACKSTWTFSEGQEYMWWNNVETKPYGGYPQHWDVKLLALMDRAHQRAGTSMTWNAAARGAQKPYGEYDGLTLFEAVRHHYDPQAQKRVLGYL